MARMYSILLALHKKLNTRKYIIIHSGVKTWKKEKQNYLKGIVLNKTIKPKIH